MSRQKGFFEELWIIFKESFYLDYNRTLFCSNLNHSEGISVEYTQNDVKISNSILKPKTYRWHFFLIWFLLVLVLSVASLYFLGVDLPSINYQGGYLSSNNSFANYSNVMFIVRNEYNSNDFNANLSKLTENSIISYETTSLNKLNITNKEFISFANDSFSKNYSMIVLFGHDFIGYIIKSNIYSLSITKVDTLNFNDVFKIILFVIFLAQYLIVFLFNILYAITLSQLYRWLTSNPVSFWYILRFSMYSFIPASIINFILLVLFNINIYILIIMLIFVVYSINNYRTKTGVII